MGGERHRYTVHSLDRIAPNSRGPDPRVRWGDDGFADSADQLTEAEDIAWALVRGLGSDRIVIRDGDAASG